MAEHGCRWRLVFLLAMTKIAGLGGWLGPKPLEFGFCLSGMHMLHEDVADQVGISILYCFDAMAALTPLKLVQMK